MKLKLFLFERIGFLIGSFLIIGLVYKLLDTLKVDFFAIIFSCSLFLISNISLLFYEYCRKSAFLKELNRSLEGLDEKYLLSEVVSRPEKDEEKAFYNILKECNKSMNDAIAKVEIENKDYKEYIELWVHEVKNPIASSKLIIENNRNPQLTSIEEEIDKIEEYIEQALFYARSAAVEKDFIINRLSLEEIVNSSIKRSSKELIAKSVKVSKENLNYEVYTDKKWVDFIIHQILSNSIKYFNKEHNSLCFSCEEVEESLVLNIIDNGIGMNEKALLKAFDKGYTGENGRQFKGSTGIGLYLCKKLCIRLGLSISIDSKEGKGTRVSILFSKNDMMIFE
ncbi:MULTISPECIES: sensor histidine kinase [Clostridium]|uniref:histidine kinase n=1 Tax=Clostridium cibarium TaxID=2762247 RepID=A0ABR8PW85_9CLOT|nr:MULTISPECIES: sensor histidine kinase [Clostridium]MBD7912421.1 sensor histidine kinase [Clostridium cibarium]